MSVQIEVKHIDGYLSKNWRKEQQSARYAEFYTPDIKTLDGDIPVVVISPEKNTWIMKVKIGLEQGWITHTKLAGNLLQELKDIEKKELDVSIS